MSLINDALKRASQSDRNRPRPAHTHTAMEPVADRRDRTLSLVLGACVILALALAALFFWQWWNVGLQTKIKPIADVAPKAAPAPVVPVASVAPVVPVAPVVHEVVPPPVATPSPQPVVPTPVPVPAPAPPPAKPVEEKWPADLKVMGIFFSKTNPRALINGKTIHVGDLIAGIRVTKIENDRVTVEWNGRVKELMLE